MSGPVWLKSCEVAEEIRETVANVSRRAKRGEFPGAVQIGRNWRIPRSGLDAFLSPAQVESPAAEPVYLSADHKREMQRAS